MFNGWSARVRRFAYWTSSESGICETPAYAMQVLAELMGNLSLSGGWDYLTTNKLADRYDFGKTSLISYATGITDPHYMENYYLIQKLIEAGGNPDAAYTNETCLYTNEQNRPLHTHSYSFHPYEDQMPSCTQPGLGYMECKCSEINAAWYDDVIRDVEIPALGHEISYTDNGDGTHTEGCARCDYSATEPCVYEDGVCVCCGHVKAQPRPVTVYVVDELDGEGLYAWTWGPAGNPDAAWPGHALSVEGYDKGDHPYYKLELDLSQYNMLVLNRNGQPQSADLSLAEDAGERSYVVYYLYGVSGNDLQISAGDDIWPAPGTVTEPTCTEGGYTSYTGLYTGEIRVGDETPALGHQPKAAVTENNVEPTCTAEGSYDSVVYCERCNEEISRETVSVDALGHNPGEPVEENRVEPTATTEGGYDTVVYCTRCNAELSREHTVLPATGLPEPVLDENLKLYPSISVGIELRTTFGIRKAQVSAYADWYVEVSKLDADGNVTATKTYNAENVQDGYLLNAVYTDVTAKEMGVRYSAVLHCIDAQGAETYSNAYTYTLRDYLIGELTNDDNPDAVRTLAADLLNYGAAAQVYFDFDAENLVNENLDAEAAADLAQYQTQNEAPAEKVNSAEGPNLFSSVSIKNRVVLNLTSRGLNTEGNVQVQVKLGDTVKATLDTTKVGSVYTARYDQIEAAEMRSEFQFVTLVDGVETGNTLTWSLEGYVNFSRNNPDASPSELALMNAMLKYVDAVRALNAN